MTDATIWGEIGRLIASAIGGGVVGSVITAWNGWGIEKRRMKHQRRSQLISDWRRLIASLPDLGGWSGSDPKCRSLLRSEHFISLEPYLPKNLLDGLRTERRVTVGDDYPRRQLSEEVSKIEKRWGLI